MRKLISMLAAALFVTALMGGGASADNEWCAKDPVFNIRGTVFRLTASVQGSASDVTGIAFDVTLPADAAGVTTIAYPHGGVPVTVNVRYTGPSSVDGYAVSALVTVSGTPETRVRIELSGPSVVNQTLWGSTNSAVPVTFTAQK